MRYLAWVLLLGLATLVIPEAIHAQGPSELVVLHTDLSDERSAEEGMIVRAYFTLRKADGSPILKEQIDLTDVGTIELLGENRTARAVVDEPDVPIKIVVLLDSSGSMIPNIGVARAAAQKALGVAPERAQIFIYHFSALEINQSLGSRESFSENRELWQREIDAWRPKDNAVTCLYNATYQAVQLLAEAARPEERRAVIVFTDGVDETLSGEQCSERGPENTILKAQEFNVPIYSIGLCESNSCGQIDVGGLERLSRRTNGNPVTGRIDELEARFAEIMAILDSQWMARATVFPRKGDNRATLTINPEGKDPPILGDFNIRSLTDYFPPPVFEPSATYQEEADSYLINLNASNLQSVSSLQITIFNVQGGTVVEEVPVPLAGVQSPITLSAAQLQAEQDYCFQVRATNQAGEAIRLSDDLVERGHDPMVLGESCVSYMPKLGFTIDAITPRWADNKLDIQLNVLGGGRRQLIFNGTIVHKSGSKIIDISRAVPDQDLVIRIDLPDDLRDAGEKDEFLVRLRTEAGGQTLEHERSFTITDAPARPNLILPIGLGFLFVAAVVVVVGLIYQSRLSRPQALPAPRQYSDLTGPLIEPPPKGRPKIGGRDPAAAGPRLRIKVVQTPDPTQKQVMTVSAFPFLIGRGERDTQLPIPGDNGMSRHHVQISLSGGELTLTDLKSLNGTFIEEKRLVANQPMPIKGQTRVRLGPHTIIEIEPLK